MTQVEEAHREKTAALPLGSVEPHRSLLQQPEPGTLLFKIVRIRDLIDMLQKSYLHFQRVDKYGDDPADGEQLPLDRSTSVSISFEKAPEFTLEQYYDIARNRTYACCFSLEDSSYLWENYAPNRDAVCLVFDFDKLRERLNATIQSTLDNPGLLMQGETPLQQIFSINYGIVEYVDKQNHALHPVRIANPIQFTFLKEKVRYTQEKELRVALSALGIGRFVLENGSEIEFHSALQMGFDFREAFSAKIIREVRWRPEFVDDCHLDILRSKLAGFHMLEVQTGKILRSINTALDETP